MRLLISIVRVPRLPVLASVIEHGCIPRPSGTAKRTIERSLRAAS